MRYLKFALAISATVALLSGMVLAAPKAPSVAPPSPAAVPYVLEGMISAIDLAKGAITLDPNPGQLSTRPAYLFFINAQTRIFKNGQAALLRDLAVGDLCRAEIKETLEGVPVALNVQTRSQQPPQPQLNTVVGAITAIDPTGLTFDLTVKTEANTGVVVVKFFADKETKIRKNGSIVGFDNLRVGDMAGVGYVPNPTMQPGSYIHALVIEAKSPVAPPPTSVILEGIIGGVDLIKGSIVLNPPAGSLKPSVIFYVTNTTKIYKNGQLSVLSALAVGDTCRAEAKPTAEGVLVALNVQAKSVVVPPPAATILEGVIGAIDLTKGSITLNPPAGSLKPSVIFYVVDATKIYKDGQLAKLSALAVGDICRAEARPAANGALVASSVQVKSPQPPQPQLKSVAGTITAIDPTGLTFDLTVKSEASASSVVMKFFADKETKIRKNGNIVGFDNLRVGDMAGVGYVPNPTMQPGSYIHALVIEAKSPVAPPPTSVILEGVIGAIDLTKGSITLNPPAGSLKPSVIFYVVDATKIYKNGQLAKLSALAVGDTCRAEAKPTAEGVLVALNVQAKSVVVPPPAATILEGIIGAVDLAKGSITLNPPAGSLKPSVIFYVVDATKIYKNGQLAKLSALAVGDICRAEARPAANGTLVASSVQAKSPVKK